jgi:CheY-like chemotaxis protein
MSTSLKNVTILVIDDDRDTCEMLRTMLESYGANVTIANSVQAALDVCRHNPPHLVLSDIRLGSSDGFALIEEIRKYNAEYRGFTPAIALTGYFPPGDEVRAKAAGFNAYIHKPFDPTNLVDTIVSVLRSSSGLAA